MELSVIIVNYNVKHFLEQCLHSVVKASKSISVEIFVVDNHSVDGSTQLIRERFPGVHLIENKENTGFSRANNQALREASGKYLLLLNPDTVVEEDTFTRVIRFMEEHPECGGLGVKMIDGKGNFLPESKRGLPTPAVAFYKMSGLSKLFPKSKKFGKYHLSYLDENETHEVEVLAGAFMLLRKETLKKIGLLDETFFMYGEDIDLSLRIMKSGYKNYYFPETTIIHYKGESTKKGSLNYVKVFYKAMIIFAKKHFTGGKASIFTFLLNLAIWFRALLSVFRRLVDFIFLPLLDALIMYAGFLIITPLWEKFRYEPDYYPSEFINFAVPVYILFWLTAIFFSGGYKKPVHLMHVARGLLWGTIAILLAYSLVDETFRFSRALIFLGSIWALFTLLFYRLFFHWMKWNAFKPDIQRTKKIAIAGHLAEALRVREILQRTQIKSEFAGFISVDSSDHGEQYIGSLDQLNEIVRINRIDEIIFCAENIRSTEIIRAMLELTSLDIDFKIAPPESISIIGSNSIHTAGDLYVVHINAITKPDNRKKKRLLDLIFSVIFLVSTPFMIWFFIRKTRLLKNIWQVINGNKSWIGYAAADSSQPELPPLRPGILSPTDMFDNPSDDPGKIHQLNVLYARNYSLLTDIEILSKGWKSLDR
ncbi:MAG: glycosyltransferase [Mariniphaga sp.]|nr:glycosyltransferase [Mariniphaga sp.]